MSREAATGAGPRIRLHESAVVEDRGGEVAVFVADKGSGSVLRGVPALMFRSLYTRFGRTAFTADEAAQDAAAGGAERWRAALDALTAREILVPAAAPRGSVAAPELVRVLFHGRPQDAKRLAELLAPSPNVEVGEAPLAADGPARPGEVAVRLGRGLDVRADIAFAREQSGLSRPSLLARVYGENVELGPWTLPRRSPCFECYWLRLQSGRETEVPESMLGLVGRGPETAERTLEIETALILIAGEVGKAAAGTPPVTLGQVVRHDLRAVETVKHKVMRVPTCAACAAARRELP